MTYYAKVGRKLLLIKHKECLENNIIYYLTSYLHNFDPLKPHFYIIKFGFSGVYIIFLISAENIDCGYSFEPPWRGRSND